MRIKAQIAGLGSWASSRAHGRACRIARMLAYALAPPDTLIRAFACAKAFSFDKWIILRFSISLSYLFQSHVNASTSAVSFIATHQYCVPRGGGVISGFGTCIPPICIDSGSCIKYPFARKAATISASVISFIPFPILPNPRRAFSVDEFWRHYHDLIIRPPRFAPSAIETLGLSDVDIQKSIGARLHMPVAAGVIEWQRHCATSLINTCQCVKPFLPDVCP